MADFNEFIEALKENLLPVVKEGFETYKDQVFSDGSAFAEKMKDDLQKWLLQLKDGSLTKSDFEFLVKGKGDLAEMEALKLAGLAQVKVEMLKKSIIQTVIGTAEKFFL